MKSVFAFLFFISIGMSALGQKDAQTLVNEGIKLHDGKEYLKAIQKYEEALKLDKDSWLAHYEMAFSYFELKNYEKAIEHSEISIKHDKNNAYFSYVILGSAYDLINNPKKAIKTYQKGIKKFPEVSLLHYNLALTYYQQKDLASAEPHAIEAIKLNPGHPSSHLILAYLNYDKGKRIESVLPLYHFLMLEPNSPRAEQALNVLHGLLEKGVSKDGDKNVNITLSVSKEEDDFGAAEMMMSLLEASKNLEENEGKTSEELFFENSVSMFKILGELKDKKKKGFWWNFYVPYFYKMAQDDQVETMAYLIQLSSQKEPVLNWLRTNETKLESFSQWNQNYSY